jgi:hypothetical protein
MVILGEEYTIDNTGIVTTLMAFGLPPWEIFNERCKKNRESLNDENIVKTHSYVAGLDYFSSFPFEWGTHLDSSIELYLHKMNNSLQNFLSSASYAKSKGIESYKSVIPGEGTVLEYTSNSPDVIGPSRYDVLSITV